jgi:hypothetical protein
MITYHIHTKANSKPNIAPYDQILENTNVIPEDLTDEVTNISCFAALTDK